MSDFKPSELPSGDEISQYFKDRDAYNAEHHKRLETDEDVYRFLLGKSLNAQHLPAQQLPDEVELVATSSHKTERQIIEEAGMRRQTAEAKAKADAAKYKLTDEDAIALEQLYVGLTQPDLPIKKQPYELKIVRGGEQTVYDADLPKAGEDDQAARDPHLQGAIRAYPSELRGKEPQAHQRLTASSALFDAILSEFDYIGLVNDGVQIRKSGHPLFGRSALLGLAIIQQPHYKEDNSGVTHEIPSDPFQNPVKVLEVAPINRLTAHAKNFNTFADNLGKSI